MHPIVTPEIQTLFPEKPAAAFTLSRLIPSAEFADRNR
jgi:hypothetical protein